MVTSAYSALLKSKFRGCMIGVSVGDCLGVPFEFTGYVVNDIVKIIPPSKQRLGEFMTNLIDGDNGYTLFYRWLYDPFLWTEFHYTDDTCMTISVAASLVDQDEVNAKDMAER